VVRTHRPSQSCGALCEQPRLMNPFSSSQEGLLSGPFKPSLSLSVSVTENAFTATATVHRFTDGKPGTRAYTLRKLIRERL